MKRTEKGLKNEDQEEISENICKQLYRSTPLDTKRSFFPEQHHHSCIHTISYTIRFDEPSLTPIRLCFDITYPVVPPTKSHLYFLKHLYDFHFAEP